MENSQRKKRGIKSRLLAHIKAFIIRTVAENYKGNGEIRSAIKSDR